VVAHLPLIRGSPEASRGAYDCEPSPETQRTVDTRGESVARAKQTNRAEARRRYRIATQPDDATLDEPVEAATAPGGKARPAPKLPAPKPSTSNTPQRMGFMGAFRGAYHPARPREDLRALPSLLVHWSFLAAAGLVLVGAAAYLLFPNYTGSAFGFELLVLPGSALAPQLVAGFFAKRASYILGFIIGLLQGVVFSVLLTQFASRVGGAFPADKIGNLFTMSFVTGPVSGALFSAAAAWYRRFLALSSPRRQMQPGRSGAKQTPKRSTARR
jgi:hypothetical protein